MKELLEDKMNRLEAENVELKAKNKDRRDRIKKLEMMYENTGAAMSRMTLNMRIEELEVKYATVCEVFENLLDDMDNAAISRGSFYELRKTGRDLLNGTEL